MYTEQKNRVKEATLMTVEQQLQYIIENMATKDDIKDMATKDAIQRIDNKLKSLELTLENESNRNIKLIAEGHLDLSRKLDDSLRVNNEKEMLLIRVNILENELRKIKEKLEIA